MNNKLKQTAEYVKQRWWVAVILVVLLTLFIIPSKTGLPGSNYQGCTIKGSYCTTGIIKGITKESDGSTIITVSVADDKQSTKELNFHLKSYNGSYAAGNKVFMNILDDPKDVILFIERDSRLLWTVLSGIFGGSPAMTARVNQNTMTEVK